VSHYAYSVSGKGLWFNLYGSNKLFTELKDGSLVKLTQETIYPWEGIISIKLDKVPKNPFSLFFRIPAWAKNAGISINGKIKEVKILVGEYLEINQKWVAGDVIELDLPMHTTLMEANPLVEETRNQVAVKRGPIIYCIESADLAGGKSIFDVIIPATASFRAEK
jgi:DUF1680 family protein